MEQYLRLLWLLPLGFFAGGYGTVIGAGGGFILAPILLLLYPDELPETVTCISLTVVFFNSLSGTLAYAKSRRVDYKSGVIFSVATTPGAILGAIATSSISRVLFDPIVGLILLVTALLLALTSGETAPMRIANPTNVTTTGSERNQFKLLLGIPLSTAFGFVSSFFGIGGGFIYVPALVYVLRFPIHKATATSLFILTISAFAGSATHILTGAFQHGVRRAVALSIGAIIGAQVGANLSRRLRGNWIIKSLAIALGLVGVRLLVSSLW
jgi:uncharacterized membrane protein YfcA